MTTRTDRTTTDAYLRRLRLEREPVGADALFRLQQAHVERVSYETFWLHLHAGWGIAQQASMVRIASGRRGGYCFHLNGAFAGLLTELGYRTTMHIAGVHDHDGPNADTMGNHVALIVHDVPTDTNPEGRWYLDAGLGDVLYEPMPLVDGARSRPSDGFSLERVVGGLGDWRFDAGPGSSLGGVSLDLRPVPISVFAARHRHNVTSPQSSFARTATAQRRHQNGSDVLRGCVLTRASGTTRSVLTLTTKDQWLDVLVDVFDLDLMAEADPAQSVDELWVDIRVKHRIWLDQQTHTRTRREQHETSHCERDDVTRRHVRRSRHRQ